MKVLIYSDVHGNLPAFKTMLEKEGLYDKYICLGDLVNYGPWSNECVELAISLPNSTIIMGNHESAFIKGIYPGDNLLVKSFFKKAYSSFTKSKEISRFVNSATLDHFVCSHTINKRYVYPDSEIILSNNHIIGHSHHQFSYSNNDFILFNTGSVGQNRKYINEINYLTYNTDTKLISMKSLLYDITPIINQMKKKNYPKICIDYYLEKDTKVNPT